jgi:hypothetical protein
MSHGKTFKSDANHAWMDVHQSNRKDEKTAQRIADKDELEMEVKGV